MPYPGQVFEDPDYYEVDLDEDWEAYVAEQYNQQEKSKALEDFDPFNTVNS